MGLALCSSNEQTTDLSKELATKAHDVELTIANSHDNSFSVVESKKNRAEFGNNAKFCTSSTKEAMTISKAMPV